MHEVRAQEAEMMVLPALFIYGERHDGPLYHFATKCGEMLGAKIHLPMHFVAIHGPGTACASAVRIEQGKLVGRRYTDINIVGHSIWQTRAEHERNGAPLFASSREYPFVLHYADSMSARNLPAVCVGVMKTCKLAIFFGESERTQILVSCSASSFGMPTFINSAALKAENHRAIVFSSPDELVTKIGNLLAVLRHTEVIEAPGYTTKQYKYRLRKGRPL